MKIFRQHATEKELVALQARKLQKDKAGKIVKHMTKCDLCAEAYFALPLGPELLEKSRRYEEASKRSGISEEVLKKAIYISEAGVSFYSYPFRGKTWRLKHIDFQTYKIVAF